MAKKKDYLRRYGKKLRQPVLDSGGSILETTNRPIPRSGDEFIIERRATAREIYGLAFDGTKQECRDRDRRTKGIRGVLCTSCDFSTAPMIDDPGLPMRAIDYLEGCSGMPGTLQSQDSNFPDRGE